MSAEKALAYALRIIESYEFDCRNLANYLEDIARLAADLEP